MGLLDEAKAQMRQGRAAAERATAGRSLSADTTIKARLSVYWPAALFGLMTAAATWRFGPPRALAFGIGAGLITTIALAALLRALVGRAKAGSARRAS